MPSCRRPSRARPIADAHRVHQVHGALLEHAGTDALDDVLAAVALDDDRVDAGLVQQLPQHQARGARADDADLGAVRVACGPDDGELKFRSDGVLKFRPPDRPPEVPPVTYGRHNADCRHIVYSLATFRASFEVS